MISGRFGQSHPTFVASNQIHSCHCRKTSCAADWQCIDKDKRKQVIVLSLSVVVNLRDRILEETEFPYIMKCFKEVGQLDTARIIARAWEIEKALKAKKQSQ